MSFHSILFDGPEYRNDVVSPPEPAFFGDLNLDQVVASITGGLQEYDLTPFFYIPLRSVEAIAYRHDILRDLEKESLFECIGSFAERMRSMRDHLSQAAKLHYRYQEESWFLDATGVYCDAVVALARDLTLVDLESRGFMAFREYLTDYAESADFTALVAETNEVRERLSGIAYGLHILDNRITVSTYDGEVDYSADVAATFERFKRGAVKDYRVNFPSWVDMNHVEAGVLDLVAGLYPDAFAALDSFCDHRRNFLDETVGAFDREVQFYVAYLRFVEGLKAAGLKFCYPRVSARSKAVIGREAFDVALANKLVPEKLSVVCNDFYLEDPERIFVVSGPNQGGKTTFARTFGQMHFLGSIGCLVPGSQAQLFLFDRMFTHFEKEENLKDLSGKLQDDLLRIRDVLGQATPRSLIIMNEIFTSTTLSDAIFLGTKVLEEVITLDLLCVCVTFVDELASLSETTVSMVSTVVPEDPAERTYKIVRKPPDGLAYALAIAEKYRLTYEALQQRITS